MRSSLRKLRGLAAPHHHKGDPKEKRRRNPNSQVDELAQATQDMQDMRDCYESLLSAAAATANSAYEFSEALKELGTCLLQKTALNDDEESGRVLLMIGKAQFELQKLVDNYRSHISQTITTPSESLLNELRTVEEMKRQCDEKREVFNYMLASHKEKGRPRNSKGRHCLSQQLQQVQEAYEEEATLFVFRLKSLKQGQSRSLLTQATRHHAAQLNFFQKGNKSLEAVEPHVKSIAEQQRIDYQFSGLEDDGSEDDDNYSYGYNDSELSFDDEQTEHGLEGGSASRSSMELDEIDNSSAPISDIEPIKENMYQKHPAFSFNRVVGPSSYSAPIFADKKIDFAEKIKEFQSSKKFHSYVLPTPADSKSAKLASSDAAHVTSTDEKPAQLWHSSPLQVEKNVRSSGVAQVPVFPLSSEAQSVLKEDKKPVQKPPPLPEHLSLPKFTVDFNPHTKKIKRQAFSGPLTKKAWANNILSSSPNPTDCPSMVPPVSVHGFTRQSSSRRVSFGASQPLAPSPKISELHELPRPPLPSARSTRPLSMTGYSAPLVSRSPEDYLTRKSPSISPQKASPLPVPPGTITRSFSIPSSSARTDLSAASRLSEAHSSDMLGGISSCTLSQISPINSQPVS